MSQRRGRFVKIYWSFLTNLWRRSDAADSSKFIGHFSTKISKLIGHIRPICDVAESWKFIGLFRLICDVVCPLGINDTSLRSHHSLEKLKDSLRHVLRFNGVLLHLPNSPLQVLDVGIWLTSPFVYFNCLCSPEVSITMGKISVTIQGRQISLPRVTALNCLTFFNEQIITLWRS